jgi:acyl-CoA synthetase (AMP-forming)/AMP-acid ligase II
MIDGSMQAFPLTLNAILDHAAKWHPETEVATGCADGSIARIGYAALRARALRVSRILSNFGTVFGSRVATLAWNSQAHVEAWYAVMGMGAVCHTLNPRLTPAHLAAMLVQSEARILIVSADLLPLARQLIGGAPAIEHILVIDLAGDDAVEEAPAGHARVAALEPMIGHADEEFRWGGFDENAPSGLCFTSGSTGAPKGVTYTHRANFLHTLRLLQADVLGTTSADAVLPVVPMFHASAWGFPFAVPASGGKLVLPGRHTDGASLARLIASEGVTVAVGVPTVWLGLCDHMAMVGGRLPSLRRIISGGAPLPPALMKRMENELGVIVQTSWGMTELSPVGTFGILSDPTTDACVSGRPSIGLDLMVADDQGVPLPEQRNQEGRLHVRGGAVIERYFGQDSAATGADGWFDTGDLARIDAAGNLRITGRAKDLIKSGGEWINPSEIEAVVSALPDVSLAAVIGRSDPKWSERPILLVELRDGREISDEELLASLKGRIASWWVPDAVIRLAAMPLAATGKIDKLRLRQLYGEG